MQTFYVSFRGICGIALLILLAGCLREMAMPLTASFEGQVQGQYHTSPLVLQLRNTSRGADSYSWTFEGGTPATSDEKDPGRVVFAAPGEHQVTLRAWNTADEAVHRMSVRVDSAVTLDFEANLLVNDFAPADLRVLNKSKGATSYHWTFEGGIPASSQQPSPDLVRFPSEGVYKVRLEASNGSQVFVSEKQVKVAPSLQPAFEWSFLPVDRDMEAPFTLLLTNTSRNGVSQQWTSSAGTFSDRQGQQTSLRVQESGLLTVTLTADNLKEKKTVSRELEIKPNTGLFVLSALQFGISKAHQAKGIYLCADEAGVLRSVDILSEQTGAKVDLGFFALNSTFASCYFFSPQMAANNGFPEIPGATVTKVCHAPKDMTAADFDRVARSSDFDAYDFSFPTDGRVYISLAQLPKLVLFKTQDGRRGGICIRAVYAQGLESYMTADVKIEKRSNQ